MVPAHSKEIFYLEYGHKPRMLQQQLFPSLLHASKIRLKVDKQDILSKSQVKKKRDSTAQLKFQ
jgi:hypothetical protein